MSKDFIILLCIFAACLLDRTAGFRPHAPLSRERCSTLAPQHRTIYLTREEESLRTRLRAIIIGNPSWKWSEIVALRSDPYFGMYAIYDFYNTFWIVLEHDSALKIKFFERLVVLEEKHRATRSLSDAITHDLGATRQSYSQWTKKLLAYTRAHPLHADEEPAMLALKARLEAARAKPVKTAEPAAAPSEKGLDPDIKASFSAALADDWTWPSLKARAQQFQGRIDPKYLFSILMKDTDLRLLFWQRIAALHKAHNYILADTARALGFESIKYQYFHTHWIGYIRSLETDDARLLEIKRVLDKINTQRGRPKRGTKTAASIPNAQTSSRRLAGTQPGLPRSRASSGDSPQPSTESRPILFDKIFRWLRVICSEPGSTFDVGTLVGKHNGTISKEDFASLRDPTLVDRLFQEWAEQGCIEKHTSINGIEFYEVKKQVSIPSEIQARNRIIIEGIFKNAQFDIPFVQTAQRLLDDFIVSYGQVAKTRGTSSPNEQLPATYRFEGDVDAHELVSTEARLKRILYLHENKSIPGDTCAKLFYKEFGIIMQNIREGIVPLEWDSPAVLEELEPKRIFRVEDAGLILRVLNEFTARTPDALRSAHLRQKLFLLWAFSHSVLLRAEMPFEARPLLSFVNEGPYFDDPVKNALFFMLTCPSQQFVSEKSTDLFDAINAAYRVRRTDDPSRKTLSFSQTIRKGLHTYKIIEGNTIGIRRDRALELLSEMSGALHSVFENDPSISFTAATNEALNGISMLLAQKWKTAQTEGTSEPDTTLFNAIYQALLVFFHNNYLAPLEPALRLIRDIGLTADEQLLFLAGLSRVYSMIGLPWDAVQIVPSSPETYTRSCKRFAAETLAAIQNTGTLDSWIPFEAWSRSGLHFEWHRSMQAQEPEYVTLQISFVPPAEAPHEELSAAAAESQEPHGEEAARDEHGITIAVGPDGGITISIAPGAHTAAVTHFRQDELLAKIADALRSLENQTVLSSG